MTTPTPPAAQCLSPRRARQVAEMVAIHLEGGRWEQAHDAIDYARRQAAEDAKGQPQTVAELLDLPLGSTDLRMRTVGMLEGAGILTVGMLLSQTKADLMTIRNMGKETLGEIFEVLAGLGLKAERGPGDVPKKSRRGRPKQLARAQNALDDEFTES